LSCSCGSHNHSVSSPPTVFESYRWNTTLLLWGDCSIESCKNNEEWWETILGVPSLQGMICDFQFRLSCFRVKKHLCGLIFLTKD